MFKTLRGSFLWRLRVTFNLLGIPDFLNEFSSFFSASSISSSVRLVLLFVLLIATQLAAANAFNNFLFGFFAR